MRSLRAHVLRFGLLALGVAGCNSILDNKPGTLKQSTAVTPTQPTQEPTTPPESGSVEVTPPAPTTPSPTGECAEGTYLCNGQCVGKNDPAYGCGSAACTPCTITHGSATCAAGACAVKVCDKGYSDCDGKPENGCETDLSKAASCGSCNAVCPASAPVCAPAGGSFQCGTGCSALAPLLCGTECVEPTSSVNHCGGCETKCPDVPNGETKCSLGQCGFTCHPDFHECLGRCAAANDATACGPGCALCPAAANATPSCTADQCGFVCAAGFGDCNLEPEDGCESTFASDPLNCGECGKSCNGGTCTSGVCSPPPTDDAGSPPPP